MPLLNISIPEGAFNTEQKERLVGELTETLLKWEGAPAGNTRAASIAWAYLEEVKTGHLAVGGKLLKAEDSPRYRVMATVPQGALNDETKRGLVEDVTKVVLGIEGTPLNEENSFRVWCIINEVTDGNWGGGGQIFRLKDIRAFVMGKKAKAEVVEKLVTA